MPQHPLIEIDNAQIYNGDTCVFDSLSLCIAQHENTAILGPNGAGKSTLLRVLSRDIYPVARENSRVCILGKERWNVFELRNRLGIVSHELQMRYEPTTLGIDVVLSGFFASIGVHQHQHPTESQRSKAEAALEKLGATRLRDVPLSSMSAGEQRRCLLARALVHAPETLILDEPTTSLDLRATFELLALIGDLVRNGKTLILVTHHVHEIPPAVTRVVLLKRGAVFADGPKSSVLSDDNLSRLFEVPIRVREAGGYFQAFPAN